MPEAELPEYEVVFNLADAMIPSNDDFGALPWLPRNPPPPPPGGLAS